MKMKKKAGAAAKKGAPTKKGAATKKPAAKTPPSRKAAAKAEPKAPGTQMESTKRAGTYTPSQVQGIGWAPFRYPPQ